MSGRILRACLLSLNVPTMKTRGNELSASLYLSASLPRATNLHLPLSTYLSPSSMYLSSRCTCLHLGICGDLWTVPVSGQVRRLHIYLPACLGIQKTEEETNLCRRTDIEARTELQTRTCLGKDGGNDTPRSKEKERKRNKEGRRLGVRMKHGCL